MLDLQPGVHLDEEELVGGGVGDEELDGPGALVCDAARDLAGGLADACAGRAGWIERREQRRRRLLDDLLVPALQRALALAQMDRRARAVGEHLHLDVARAFDEPLEQQGVVAERGRSPPAVAEASAAGSSPASRTTCIPLPPPPADGLMSSG